MKTPWRLALVLVAALGGCGGGTEAADGIDDVAVPPDKADSPYTECQLAQVVAYLNLPATTYDVLRAAGVAKQAAQNLVAHRDGADGQPGTADDDRFDDILEVDAVSFVGPVALGKLVAAVTSQCTLGAQADVIFSPQPYATSHLARVARHIDEAQRSLDLALYSFSDAPIVEALKRALARGVKVRLLFDPSNEHRTKPEGTMSARLEDLGINVRYVNKIMHHKFAIVDGPRDAADQAATALLITGSGNWSNSAGTKYDENTVFIRENPELLLRFQREFNLLWDNSRDFKWNQSLPYESSLPITAEMITDQPGIDVVFTSANFTVKETSYGPTFSIITGANTVADRLVGLIEGAEKSIHLASGHLRSWPVAEALMARHAADPTLDIKIYLDGQEFISEWYHAEQVRKREACLTAAGTSEAKKQACLDNSFYYSYQAHQAGIPLRFKYYAYRWDASYAIQMHHKYVVIDGRVLASGSYNLSDNAEHATMENLVVYEGAAWQPLVNAFEANFASMWETGRANDGLGTLTSRVTSGPGDVPLVFDPLALTHPEVAALKDALHTACPAVDSEPYRSNPPAHKTCPR